MTRDQANAEHEYISQPTRHLCLKPEGVMCSESILVTRLCSPPQGHLSVSVWCKCVGCFACEFGRRGQRGCISYVSGIFVNEKCCTK